MTLRYAEGDFTCQECGSTRLEYDEALRGGFLSGFFSSFGVAPSGFGFPGLVRITRGFPFRRRGGFPAAGQRILLPHVWHCPRLLGLFGAQRYRRGSRVQVPGFQFRGSGSGFQFGRAVVVFFLSGTRTRFCFLETDFVQEEHVDVSVFETQTKQGVKAYEVLGLS